MVTDAAFWQFFEQVFEGIHCAAVVLLQSMGVDVEGHAGVGVAETLGNGGDASRSDLL